MKQAARQVAVIGAGTMGSGIAQKYASSGFRTIIIDNSQQAVLKSQAAIKGTLDQAITRGIYSEREALEIFDRIEWSHELQKADRAELIIEAIFEDKLQKISLIKALEEICSNDALIATNTSSLKVADLQQEMTFKGRFLGLHYFYPPSKNRLVELIGTKDTHKNAMDKARLWQRDINKIVIESKDSPGFIVNRFFVPWLNQAMSIAFEGVASIATVEEAAKRFFKIPMGPFTLMNVTGLPITYHASTALAHYLGSFYAPCPMLMKKMSENSQWQIDGVVDERLCMPVGLRLMAVVGAICCRMVQDEKICSKEDVDTGARVGLLWGKGPFELMREHNKSMSESFRELAIPKDYVTAFDNALL